MNNSIYFHTPGHIPVKSFSTFGLNSKPNSDDPFGEFGTGLKYAVSVLLRNQAGITVFVGGIEYDFYTAETDFRGKDFQICRMRKRYNQIHEIVVPSRWRSVELPYTTHLGKNWKLWQVYRELASNTFDEGGCISLAPDSPWGSGGSTIRVESAEICDIHRAPGSVFLDNGEDAPLWENEMVEIYPGESKHLFYRGVRVYDLRNKSRFTYNFKPGHVNLTEDRTAANIWGMQHNLAQTIQRSIFDRVLLRDLMKKDSEPTFEGEDLSFDYGPGYGTSIEYLHSAKSLGENRSKATSNFLAIYSSKTANPTLSLALPVEHWALIAASLGKDRELQGLKVGQDLLKKVSELVSKSAEMLADDAPF